MSLDNNNETPSIDRYQPQHVAGRPPVQLEAPSEHLQQTGNGNPTRDDDVIVKMASQLTDGVIDSSIRVCAAAEQSLFSAEPGSEQNRKQYSQTCDEEPAATFAVSIQPSLTEETASGIGAADKDERKTVNESATRHSDVTSQHTKPEVVSSTSGDGAEAEALQDLARLQALTRQLRAAVAESRSADGLPVDVSETTSSKNSEDHDTRKSTTRHDDDTVCRLCQGR